MDPKRMKKEEQGGYWDRPQKYVPICIVSPNNHRPTPGEAQPQLQPEQPQVEPQVVADPAGENDDSDPRVEENDSSSHIQSDTEESEEEEEQYGTLQDTFFARIFSEEQGHHESEEAFLARISEKINHLQKALFRANHILIKEICLALFGVRINK